MSSKPSGLKQCLGLGVFILRRIMPDAPRSYKVWGYPLVPTFMVLFCAALVVNNFFARPREAMLGLALMLTGLPFYWWFNHQQPLASKLEETEKSLPETRRP